MKVLLAGGPEHGKVIVTDKHTILYPNPSKLCIREAFGDRCQQHDHDTSAQELVTYTVGRLLFLGHVIYVAVTDDTTDSDIVKAIFADRYDVTEHVAVTDELGKAVSR